MWTTVSVGCRIWLVALILGMLFSSSGAKPPNAAILCWKPQRLREIKNIKECYEQKRRIGCKHDAYLVEYRNGATQRDEMKALDPRLPWLKKLISKKKLNCTPDISKRKSKKLAWKNAKAVAK